MKTKALIKIFIKEQIEAATVNKKKNNVSYTALVLSREDHNKLLAHLSGMYPNDWEVIAHHITLNMGSWKGDPNLIGQQYNIPVVSFAKDGLVAAVGVKMNETGLPSKNNPHITIAVNRVAGGKPVMSNNLDWTMETQLETPIIVVGTLLEVEQGNNDKFSDEYN